MLTIQENISLKDLNTFHIDAKARFFVEVKSAQDIEELRASGLCDQYPFFLLGGGANLLFTKDYPGVIIKVSLTDKELIHKDNGNVYVKVGAGESWHQFVVRCVEHHFGGLENLSLIPGTVGASAVGNIGAYGVEVKDVIEEVEYVEVESRKSKVKSQTNATLPIKKIKNIECKFAYRESIFKHALKGKALVTAVTFRLKKVDKNYALKLDYKDIQQVIVEQGLKPEALTIKDLQHIIIAIREAKLNDANQKGTAGSFFKNPIIAEAEFIALKKKRPNLVGNIVTLSETKSISFDKLKMTTLQHIKLSAGQLIELSGLKGYVQGNVGVSRKHALVLVNLGNGTGAEMLQLANHIISEVKKNFGIQLEPEVIIV